MLILSILLGLGFIEQTATTRAADDEEEVDPVEIGLPIAKMCQ